MSHKLFDIRNLEYYKSYNVFTASKDNFRYKITPRDHIFYVEVWYGKLCYEKSQIVEKSEFTLDQDGFENLIAWLEEKYNLKPI
ncbi:hypothetical protein EDD70_2374 [Hydrogenoanaerobacterium saccharovorans]|uniref:Uncharacterized protein n=1 Tax=Hydrogenoanaerobacterium saccharovorans TaxID=474960 RepID=A0A1H8D1L7_9FIRM|nr:hypothetical protein [Hydrogenoanaerobacterium saccharovorans]RPF43410.1 hypothetical protein EDD70_2374 [Hydrogenoanaerobacterium saccharovorans]SEN00584.1 hypothetical protein SAMN05216180_2433 [Hydrogenoanaerobacterium saccharovorans]